MKRYSNFVRATQYVSWHRNTQKIIDTWASMNHSRISLDVFIYKLTLLSHIKYNYTTKKDFIQPFYSVQFVRQLINNIEIVHDQKKDSSKCYDANGKKKIKKK